MLRGQEARELAGCPHSSSVAHLIHKLPPYGQTDTCSQNSGSVRAVVPNPSKTHTFIGLFHKVDHPEEASPCRPRVYHSAVARADRRTQSGIVTLFDGTSRGWF